MIEKKNNRRTVIALILLGLLIAGGSLVYYFWKNQDPTKNYKPMYDASTNGKPEQPTGTESVKDSSGQSTLPTTSEEVPSATTGSVKVTDLNQTDGYINAKAETSNFSTQKCVYQFTSDGARPITRELEGQCVGISIPQAEFEKIGTYTLIVTAYSSDQKISSNPQTLNVR